MVRIQLLGYPRVLVGGGPTEAPALPRHRLALLALLAQAPDRTLPREKLLAMLWPESDLEGARHLLNTAVHTVRRELGESTLLSRGNALSLGDVEVDVQAFTVAVAAGNTADAVALYRAPFLDGFFLDGAEEFEAWTASERTRLNAQYRDAVEAMAVTAEAQQDWRTAVKWWRALTLEDAFNSRAVARLMLALERTGDHGNALEMAQQHEALLAKELGTAPSSEFRDMVRRMRDAPEPPVESFRNLPDDTPAAIAPDAATRAEAPHYGRTRSPALRAAMVAAATLLLAFVAFRMLQPNGDAATRPDRRVLVLPFVTSANDSALASLSVATASWIVESLTRTGEVDVIESTAGLSFEQAAEQRDDPVTAARAAGAAFVVAGTLQRAGGDSVRFQATVRNAADGRVISAIPTVSGPSNSPMRAVDEVRSRVAGALAGLLDPRIGAAAATITPPLYPAYREYLTGLGVVQTAAAVPHFLEAARLDTTFSLAFIWAAYTLDRCENGRTRFPERITCPPASWDSLVATVERRRTQLSPLEQYALDFTKAWRFKDHRLYYESAKAASRLVPVSFWTAHLYFAATDRGNSEEALNTLLQMREVTLFDRVFASYRSILASALHTTGRFDEQLAETRRMRRSPGMLDSPEGTLSATLSAMIGLGMIDSVLATADELISRETVGGLALTARELRIHGHAAAADSLVSLCRMLVGRHVNPTPVQARGASLCAQESGKHEIGRRLWESCCMQPGPGYASVLASLGALAALAGDTVDARRYAAAIDTVPILYASDTRWFAEQFDAEKLYGKARIAAALGDEDEAVALLERSFSLWGRRRLDFRHDCFDRAFDPIREAAGFQRLVRSAVSGQ